jgi:hypothetical protein
MPDEATDIRYLFDLEAQENDEGEDKVDMTEEDMTFINDEGGEDMSDDGSDDGDRGEEGHLKGEGAFHFSILSSYI